MLFLLFQTQISALNRERSIKNRDKTSETSMGGGYGIVQNFINNHEGGLEMGGCYAQR
jgi:hypothetical protein